MINIHPQYKKAKNFHKSAFTMLELIMVIVVLGILASLALPRMERDLRQEAGDNILSAIRYTQHLALMDNKTDPSDRDWQKEYWQIRFSNSGGTEWWYTIASNVDGGPNLDQSESAIDPANGKYMHSSDVSPAAADESPNIFLTRLYGIKTVDFGDCDGRTGSGGNVRNTVRHIAFDHLGRPHRGVFGATNTFSTILRSTCQIKFEFEDADDLLIAIEQETGYAQIVDQNAS